MRPRIRTIKPEALLDEGLWDAEDETGLPLFRAFVGLWCHADREGRFEWRPRALKAGILPYWDGDFSRVLDALATRGFLVRYAISGREFGLVRTFKEHQSVNGKEPPSRLPGPPDSLTDSDSSHVKHASATREEHVPHVTIPSLPVPVPVPEGGAGGNQAPANLAEALKVPPQERARQVERDPHLAEWILPQDWPEVRELAKAWGERRVGAYKRDSGVRAVVGCLADGFTLQELLRAIPRIRGSDWGKSRKLGMACMTPEVVRRALDNSQESNTVNKLEAFEDALWKAKHAAT